MRARAARLRIYSRLGIAEGVEDLVGRGGGYGSAAHRVAGADVLRGLVERVDGVDPAELRRVDLEPPARVPSGQRDADLGRGRSSGHVLGIVRVHPVRTSKVRRPQRSLVRVALGIVTEDATADRLT